MNIAKQVCMAGVLAAGVCLGDLRAGASNGKTVDEVISAYVAAAGGRKAIDRIETRETHAKERRGPRLTYFWQKPEKVLVINGKQRIGYDGSGGWMLSKKKKLSKLPKGSHVALEMDANPLRYANLKQLYPDVQAAGSAKLETGEMMDVVAADNDRGSTKFYFDSSTHLLARVEETGETSAYFKHVTEFSEYQEVDGVKLPFLIVHSSNEPNAQPREIRISEVLHNVPMKPQLFSKPAQAAVVFGGKR